MGRVITSTKPGHSVFVRDDQANTGGFLVLEWWEGSDGPNASGAFDSWVESESALCQFFKESKWQVEWSQR